MSNQAPRKASISEVARLCGVHKSTVSRVLNNRYPAGYSVSDAVKAKVLKVADELNFRPNPVLRTMSASRTGLIALLGMSDFNRSSRGPVEEAVNVMLREFADLDYRICTSFLTVGDEAYESPPWRVDGAVVLNPTALEQYEAIHTSGIPYLVMNGVSRADRPSVNVDDYAGARLAVEYLAELGHRRIAYVKTNQFNVKLPLDAQGRPHWHPSVAERERGYLAALAELGLTAVPGHGDWDRPLPDAVSAAVTQGATAILSYDHVEAVEVVGRLQRAGHKVPDDISVLCFNEAFPTAEVFPSLTAMVVPGDEMALAAVRLLKEAIDGKPYQQAVVREKIRPRESTGPAPSR
ncbi:MAG: LacI family DNA-binding transcriptional regulator [Planctomycetota bacterium]